MDGREEGFDFGTKGSKKDLEDKECVCLDLDGGMWDLVETLAF